MEQPSTPGADLSRPGSESVYGCDLPEQPLGTVLTLRCRACGEEFEWKSDEKSQRPKTYCKSSCSHRGKIRHIRATRLTLDKLDLRMLVGGAARLLRCSRCESVFGWLPSRGEQAGAPPMVCSKACEDALQRQRAKKRKREAKEAEEAARAAEEKRVAALAAAARELLLPSRYCACGKLVSPTLEAAKQAKRAIELRTGVHSEVRYYECDYGSWHWTRMGATLQEWRERRP